MEEYVQGWAARAERVSFQGCIKFLSPPRGGGQFIKSVGEEHQVERGRFGKRKTRLKKGGWGRILSCRELYTPLYVFWVSNGKESV